MDPTITQILYMARSGMLTQFSELDTVSHNLANINTIGFKSQRLNFQELLDDSIYAGVKIQSTQILDHQGALSYSANPLDMAINGAGYFAVSLPDGGSAYTRNGQFQVDSSNQIVTADGQPLIWQGQLPPSFSDLHVEPNGTVMVEQSGVWSSAGTISVTRFQNPSGLLGHGGNLWLETEVSGPAQFGTPGQSNFGFILGNAYEASNVDISEEISKMIVLQRGFEMSLRSFEKTDKMLQLAIQMRRR